VLSLGFGLIAALCWGVHDILVRYIGQKVGVVAALATVLFTGLVLITPISLIYGDWSGISNTSVTLAVLSGIAYIVGCIGLYNAFGIGPVRLVAPIVGAYPILSVGIAAYQGTPVSIEQWLAVLLVIGGVALVATLSERAESEGNRNAAIRWALLGAAGFAITFALGQAASRAGDEFSAIGITRLTAVVGIAIIAFAKQIDWSPIKGSKKILILMGFLDATALSVVMAAANLDNPEYAAVAASVFGMITIVLAWRFLSEKMSPFQWCGVVIAFAGIGFLAL
jgi:drug/metabolite transporter (DMT)-like permease